MYANVPHAHSATGPWFVKWGGGTHLLLNLDKTKEIVIDFKEGNSFSGQGKDVKVEEEYK